MVDGDFTNGVIDVKHEPNARNPQSGADGARFLPTNQVASSGAHEIWILDRLARCEVLHEGSQRSTPPTADAV